MPKKKLLLLGIILAALLGGCGASPQEKAYDEALRMEDQFGATPAQAAPKLIVQYKDVISMDPGSVWAHRAQTRVDLLEKISQDYQDSQRAK
jgi:hypothetical protein